MALKEKDFVEIEYTGIVLDDDIVFDTTKEKVAKDNNIYNDKITYAPIIVCLGQKQLLPGLEEQVIGKEVGQEYTIDLTPENAFGKKDSKLLKIVPTTVFFKNQINPMPGLAVQLDGLEGIIKIVSGGRTVVDFNHALSGKNIRYEIKVIRLVKDTLEQVKSLIKSTFGTDEFDVKIEDDVAKLSFKKKIDMPDEILKVLEKRILELVPVLKKLDFVKQ